MLTESETWHSKGTNNAIKMKMKTNQLKLNTYINYWKMNYIHVFSVIVNRIDKALKTEKNERNQCQKKLLKTSLKTSQNNFFQEKCPNIE